MITIEEALRAILTRAHALPAREIPLADALGLILAEDVVSDIDSPPFDKALMDGYALRAADVTGPDHELDVTEEIMAGDVPRHTVGQGQAARIMTGSPLPPGADTIVVVEETKCSADGQRVTIQPYPVAGNRHILRQGTCLQKDQLVLAQGTRLTAGQLGLLAEIGQDPVPAFPTPSVALLSTGNELVPPSQSPGGGQIRNSNGPMLRGLVERYGATACELGIGRDQPAELQRLIALGLEHPILVLSGGVSAGDLDLVPGILRELGVEKVFHKVRLKPGKPVWFGVRDGTLVFGLPGNPVSSFVCFRLFVSLAIRALQGQGVADLDFQPGRLSGGHQARGNRPVFFPARNVPGPPGGPPSEPWVELLPWHGSADLRTMAMADCLVELPEGRNIDDGAPIRLLR